jgi:hypothetical protein
MANDTAKELAGLQRMTPAQLREKYAEVFGEATKTGNKTWLVRRIAWRIQADAEGDLSERARARAAELARDSDLRVIPPREKPSPAVLPMTRGGGTRTGTLAKEKQDDRLPPPGTVLTRKYKGGTVQVKVLPGGFEYEGQTYGSLSAVAKAVTGSHCNGFLFFGLLKGGKK